MKRIAAILCAVLLPLAAPAQSILNIYRADTRVDLEKDGSAWVTQRWTVLAGSSGTEFYIPVGNLGPMTIGNFSVSENGEAFESFGDRWDVDKSRSFKAGKCGIVRKSDGVELCWGLGDPGDHDWTIRYRLTGLVQSYDDYDGFNYQFINKGMDPAPQSATLTVAPAFDCPKWTSDSVRVWGFGFYGSINVEDGTVVATTSEPMGYSSSMIALLRFEKGMFQPEVSKGGPFQNLVDRALDGSSYGEGDGDGGFFKILGALLAAIFGGLLYAKIAVKRGYKWKKSLFGKKKIDGWYRDIPLEGNLFAADYLLENGQRFLTAHEQNKLIGAFFLRWIMDGKVKVMPNAKNPKQPNLLFSNEVSIEDDVEADLYNWALKAAGDNLLLERNEFENWSKKNSNKLAGWPTRAVARGKSWFRNKGYFTSEGVCNEEGAAQACHLVEFNNFLKDFTISDQREASEVNLWKNYLVYAQLFGIAEKVTQQFKKLYPAQFQELSESVGIDTSTLWYMTRWTDSMSTRAYTNATYRTGSISGGGGHTSFGGGGGFSGGGFGGGGR